MRSGIHPRRGRIDPERYLEAVGHLVHVALVPAVDQNLLRDDVVTGRVKTKRWSDAAHRVDIPASVAVASAVPENDRNRSLADVNTGLPLTE